MVKSMCEFREHASSGTMYLEVVEKQGCIGDELPETVRGIRRVVSANGSGIKVQNPNGTTNSIHFLSAKLMEYQDKVLTIYEPGYRPVTAQEQELLDECQRLVEECQEKTPERNPYWVRANFLNNCPCPWLMGTAPVRGKQYMPDGTVRDSAIRGKVSIRYKVHLHKTLAPVTKQRAFKKRLRAARVTFS